MKRSKVVLSVRSIPIIIYYIRKEEKETFKLFGEKIWKNHTQQQKNFRRKNHTQKTLILFYAKLYLPSIIVWNYSICRECMLDIHSLRMVSFRDDWFIKRSITFKKKEEREGLKIDLAESTDFLHPRHHLRRVEKKKKKKKSQAKCKDRKALT